MTRSQIRCAGLQSGGVLKSVLEIYDAHLFIGVCWRRPDDPEPVYSSGSPVRILARGPVLSPLRAAAVDRHGADLCAGSNGRCVWRTLGRAPEPGRALCGDRRISRARDPPALSLFFWRKYRTPSLGGGGG